MRWKFVIPAVVGGMGLAAVWGQMPVPATAPAVRVSAVADAYKVEANIAYDQYPQTVLDVISPKAALPAGKKRPGVIMFHGTGWSKSDKTAMAPYYNLYLGRGFVVCNVEFRQPAKGVKGINAQTALDDACKAGQWFFAHASDYNVDTGKIVVTGTSGGGFLALAAGMSNFGRKDLKVAAIMNCYGAADLPALVKASNDWALLWLPDEMPDRDGAAKRLSPLMMVRQDAPPVLTIQGERDQVFPLAQGEALTQALKNAGAEASMHVMKESYHGFTMERMPEVAYETFDVFLAKHGIIKGSGATGPAPYHGVPPYN